MKTLSTKALKSICKFCNDNNIAISIVNSDIQVYKDFINNEHITITYNGSCKKVIEEIKKYFNM